MTQDFLRELRLEKEQSIMRIDKKTNGKCLIINIFI
jgi:hypothetical protein